MHLVHYSVSHFAVFNLVPLPGFSYDRRSMVNVSGVIEWESWGTDDFLPTMFSLMVSLVCGT